MRYYDNTRISDYRICPRKFYLRHVRDQVSEGTAIALIFGLSWHEAMNVVWGMMSGGKPDTVVYGAALGAFRKTWCEWGLPDPVGVTGVEYAQKFEKFGFRHPMTAAEMLMNYIQIRKEFILECEVLSIEQPFVVDIYKDDTPIKYIGRLDKVVRHKLHGILVIEHKTTSAYAKMGGFRSDYITSWSPHSQIDGYLHAAHMLYGDKVSGVWIDAALVHKTVHSQFKFIPIDRQFEQLDAWLFETREWIERIERERDEYFKRDFDADRANGNTSYFGFPKNTSSCSLYAGCSYRDICKFSHNPSVDGNFNGYKSDKWEPFDILKIEKLGLEKEDA